LAWLLSEKPHAFAIFPQGGVYRLGKVAALIDNHSKFARWQPRRAFQIKQEFK
jgi:hypothetical protein